MFCSNCGIQLEPSASICPSCGPLGSVITTVAAEPSAEPSKVGDKVKAASTDALSAFKTIAIDPVGGLLRAFQALGRERAFGAGIVFAVAFAVSIILAVVIAKPSYVRFEAKDYFQILVFSVVPFLSLALACLAARTVLRGSGSYEGDIFIAGAALLPFAAWVLILAIFGLANFELGAFTLIFAVAYSILMLYAGCTEISEMSSHLAAPAVPLIILVSGWLSSVFGRTVIGSMISGPRLF